jgi:glycosyl transferase family 87
VASARARFDPEPLLVLLAWGALLLATVAARDAQWDFWTYHFAGVAHRAGLDPYDFHNLTRFTHGQPLLPFLYPPWTLPLADLVARVPLEAGARAWLLAKLAMVLGFVLLVRRRFVPEFGEASIVACATFAFNAALVWDLQSGNVGTLELLLLWAGFAAWQRGRIGAFALAVGAASVFKLVPLAFLALLFAGPGPRVRRMAWAAGVVGAYVAALAACAALAPRTFASFLHALPASPRGEASPTVVALLADLGAPSAWRWVGWVAWVALIVWTSRPAIATARRRAEPRLWVATGVMLYGLAMPRMMAYSYALLVVPVLVLYRDMLRPPGWRVWAFAAVWCAQGIALLCGWRPAGLLPAYLPLVTAAALWWGWCAMCARRAATPTGAPAGAGR